MSTAITNGIKISVRSEYMSRESQPMKNSFMFSYHVTIENIGGDDVYLRRRHWYIFDSFCVAREVEGEGVIGEQPLIRPGEKYAYTSWVPLISEIGIMHGHFTMESESTQEQSRVKIPEFLLVADSKLN